VPEERAAGNADAYAREAGAEEDGAMPRLASHPETIRRAAAASASSPLPVSGRALAWRRCDFGLWT
jgi:hypothetical protein